MLTPGHARNAVRAILFQTSWGISIVWPPWLRSIAQRSVGICRKGHQNPIIVGQLWYTWFMQEVKYANLVLGPEVIMCFIAPVVLVELFCVPKEILTDQGTNFTAELLSTDRSEVYNDKSISPTHRWCSNQIFELILKKLYINRPQLICQQGCGLSRKCTIVQLKLLNWF